MNANYQRDTTVFHLRNVIKKREKGGSRFDLEIGGFEIQAGEFIAIVGASGCGKRTLLDMLGLALQPTSAEEFTIRIAETNTEYHIMSANQAALADIRKTCLGYVLQTGGLLPFLTVTENIHLPCALNNMTGIDDHIDTLVERLKIQEHKTKKPQFLSGGQRQRVAIARALAHRPPIVLADEPTAAVDKPTAEDIIKEFKKLTRELNVTLLMVTHDLNLVVDVADRMFTFDVKKKNEQYTRSVFLEKEC